MKHFSHHFPIHVNKHPADCLRAPTSIFRSITSQEDSFIERKKMHLKRKIKCKPPVIKPALLVLITFMACTNTEEEPSDRWTIYTAPFTTVYSLRYYQPYLYACAQAEDLWRIDISRRDSEWECKSVLNTIGATEVGIYDMIIDEDGIMFVTRPVVYPYDHSLFRSTDHGQTWSVSDSGMSYGDSLQYFDRIKKLTRIGSSLLAGGHRIYASVDGGLSWNSKTGMGTSTHQIEQDPCRPNVIWALGSDIFSEVRVIVSNDYGENWDEIAVNTIGAWEVAYTCQDTPKVFLAADEGLIYTRDSGQTWFGPVPVDSTNSDFVSLIWTDPHDPGRMIVGLGSRLYYSHDSGDSWMEIDTPLENPIRAHAYDPISNHFFLSAGSFVYKYKLMEAISNE